MSASTRRDTTVLLKRSLRHVLRSPDTILTTAVTPITMLLLFVYIFGGAIEASSGRYVDYLLPGILLAAQMPDQVARLMAHKRRQIEHETLRQLYLDVAELIDCTPDDPRLPFLADRVVAFLDAVIAEVQGAEQAAEEQISDDLVALLDAAFVDAFPCAPRLLELLEERGYTGWTNIRRVPAGPATPERGL